MKKIVFYCLPIIILLTSEQSLADFDLDGNGISDPWEQVLANKFCPCFELDSRDGGVSPEPVEIQNTDLLYMAVFNVNGQFALDTQDINFFDPVRWDHPSFGYNKNYSWHTADMTFEYTGKPPGKTNGLYYIKSHLGFPGDSPNSWRAAYADEAANNTHKDRIYANLWKKSSTEYVIQYWFFYPFNDCANKHEGDWEHINVIVSDQNPDLASITKIDFYFHQKIYTAYSGYHLVDLTHPVVFVGGKVTVIQSGSGSHGSYPRPGNWVDIGPVSADEDVHFNSGGNYLYPGRYIPYHIVEVFVLPHNPNVIDYNQNKEMSWLKANIPWGNLEVDQVGDWVEAFHFIPFFPEEIGNNAPPGPYYNADQQAWHSAGAISGHYDTYSDIPPQISWSAPSVQIPPSPPVLEIVAKAGSEVILTWMNPSGNQGTKIYYSTSPRFGRFYNYNGTGLSEGNSPITLSNPSQTSITLHNLASQDYFFAMRSYNGNGESWYSNEMKMTTGGGTLIEDETWYYGTTFLGNVFVPSGITLTIKEGATVNLNGYYLKSTGGTIIRESSVTFTPEDIGVKSGSTLKGQYSTIKSAVDNASSGQTVYPTSDSYSITENITIPASVTLVLASNSTLNFSGSSYITVSSGGSIVAGGYATITFNPADRGVRYSGTMSVNNTWGFPVLVTSALTVPSGVTLNVLGGTTVTFVNGSTNKLEVLAGGHINAEGRDYDPIKFTAQTPTLYGWKGIYVYGSDNLFYQCQFEYASYGLKLYGTPNRASDNIVGVCSFKHNFWGLYIENNDYPLVHTCLNIANNYYGIVLNNNDWAYIKDNWIFSNCDHGVFSYLNNEVRFRQCLFKENGVGVCSDSDNHIDFSWEGGSGGGNSIHDNNRYGIRIEDYKGEWAGLDWYDHNQLPNSVYDNDVEEYGAEDVWAYNSGKITYATEVYWGNNVPYDSYNCYLGYEPYHPANYTVDNSDPLTSDQTGLQKSMAGNFPSFSESSQNSGDISTGRYDDIDEEKLKAEIESNLDSENSVALLSKLCHSNHLKTQKSENSSLVITELVQYLEMLYSNNKYTLVGKKSLVFLVPGKMQQDKYEEAITLCKEGLDLLNNDDWRRLTETLIWLYIHTQKYDEAGKVLADFKSHYKNDREKVIAFLEEMLLDALQMERIPEFEKKIFTEQYIIPVEFVLEKNYPNPFNPMTTIRYGLPEESRVILKIFDSLGREVAKLIDEHQSVGYHQINWDASGYPSGIYLYQIQAGGIQKTQKMILLK